MLDWRSAVQCPHCTRRFFCASFVNTPSHDSGAPIIPPPGQPVHDFMVVGLGASAGGLKALLEFFQQVPGRCGMAFVVVVHLSPEHESRLPDLLQQATRLNVLQVTETVAIQPDHVYVISPNSLLLLYDNKLEPTKPVQKRGGRMTIDVFFEALAEAHKHRAIGVILSGTGSDGTLGVRALKSKGGVTFAQAPEDAEYDSMPRNAIASGAIDFVLGAAEMPARITAIWQNAQSIRLPALPERSAPEDSAAEAEETMRDILAHVRTRTGHDFSNYKRATLLRRIERRLQVNQLRDLGAYRTFLVEHSAEAHALLRDLLINVTWFFRDPTAWKTIEERVLPGMLAARAGESVRIWVVGCATGEEVYTIAMLLQERLSGMSAAPYVNIFATDIDEEALAFARAGLYPESAVEHVGPERLHRFFTGEHGSYRVQKQLREMVMFAVHNVLQDPPFSRLDLVCCRNLLIYLNRHVQSRVLDLLHFSLRPEGYLLLGMAESIDDEHDAFEVFDKANHIFVQRPRARVGLTLPTLPTVQPPRSVNDVAAAGGRRLVSFGELHQRLLEHYAPPSVVVDDRYDIVHLSDTAGHLLHLGPGEPSLNLLKVAPEGLRYEIKAALDLAMESMRTVERIGLGLMRNDQRVLVDVKVYPVRDRATNRSFALVILDEDVARGEAATAQRREEGSAEAGTTEALEVRVREMEAQLRAAVEQYEVQNEELKASNEELQATNEELRATTEELETGKEELQSINEELSTVNQELKNKVDETTRVSEDLHNFITSTQIASIFVDREMRLMRYTPYARDIFNVIPSDIGRPLSDITHRLEGADLTGTIRDVFDKLQPVEHEVQASDGRWYISRFLPYRTTDDRIRGAVLTFVDITQRRLAEDASRRAESWARNVVDSVREYAILTTDPAGKVETWNAGARDIFGYEPDDIVGKDAAILFTPEDRDAGVPADEMRTAREQGRAEDDRWQMRKDGTRFFASGVMAPLHDANRYGYVKILRDLTQQQVARERREEMLAEERIARAGAEEANRLKDEFLAMLSHELRNPLALILMQAEILLRVPEAKQTPRLMQAGQIIHEMVRAQAMLIDDMLDVSRARTGKLTIDRQLLPLTFVISDSIGALRRQAIQKQVTLDVRIDDSPMIVAADPVRVRQIAWNLLTNALKFTPSGGTIRVRLAREGDDARLDVEDTGQGIAPDVMPRIFEWFHQADSGSTRREGGMGIGLALVRQLVELHEGRLEAHSDGLDKGARFTVWLPLQIPSTTGDNAPGGLGEHRRLDGLRVLVVDDVQANADALRDLLDFENADVTVESSSAVAIERAAKERYDIIISDIAMPDIDGYAMLKAIRAHPQNAETPAIAYSGYGGVAEVERARVAGFDMHLTKPIRVDTLLDAIETVAKTRRDADRK
jgi:two-component system CheB/CheR fusion protein